MADQQKQIRSLVTAQGTLELSVETIDVPTPGDDEVLIRIEAAPINPSDLGIFFGSADMSTARREGASTVADIPRTAQRAMAGRAGKSLPVGNEGAGVVVAAEIKTTFASRYVKEVSLEEALSLSEISVYGKQATGEKYLINPSK